MIVAGYAFPPALHYLVDEQVWARLHGDGTATVGITAMGIGLAGEIYMCRPKTVGSAVAQGKAVAVVELAKSIVSVKSPLTGDVVEINARLARQPELVHEDPYGAGWLARLRLSTAPGPDDADAAALVHGAAVAAAMWHHAWLHGMGPAQDAGPGDGA